MEGRSKHRFSQRLRGRMESEDPGRPGTASGSGNLADIGVTFGVLILLVKASLRVFPLLEEESEITNSREKELCAALGPMELERSETSL